MTLDRRHVAIGDRTSGYGDIAKAIFLDGISKMADILAVQLECVDCGAFDHTGMAIAPMLALRSKTGRPV
jgi:hypothetical protein